MADDLKTKLTQNMVFASTIFGLAVVEEIALQALMTDPNMSLRTFIDVLKKYRAKTEKAVIIDV